MRLKSYPSSLHPDRQSLPAWIAILGLVFVSSVCILAGVGSILRLAFPVGSFAVGLFLYLRYPVFYISFTWWLWFLTPWLRRIIDYRSGWDPQGLILISPFLVTLITSITFLQNFPKASCQGSLPFILAFTGVAYSFLIGLIKTSFITAARASLDWLSPILFGFHLFVNWRNYPSYRQNIQRTFFWAVLVTGTYGILQFLVAPEWDRIWLIKSEMTSSCGSPEPFGMRVFSTMHSPGPFATTMMTGLLLLLNSQNPLHISTAVAGYLAFLLSVVRTAWGGWFIGFIILITSLKARLQMRLVVGFLVIAMCAFSLVSIPPFSDIIYSRFQSFSDLKNDTSANDRTRLYETNISSALSDVMGSGLGNRFTVDNNGKLEAIVIDSGVIDLFSTLGWFGALPYIGGIIMLLFGFSQSSRGHSDPFISAAQAISLGIIAEMPFGTATASLSGVIFWAFSAMALAGNKYYQEQRRIVPK